MIKNEKTTYIWQIIDIYYFRSHLGNTDKNRKTDTKSRERPRLNLIRNSRNSIYQPTNRPRWTRWTSSTRYVSTQHLINIKWRIEEVSKHFAEQGDRRRGVGSPDAASRLQQPGHAVPVAAEVGAVAAEVERLHLAAVFGDRGQHPSGVKNTISAKC